MTSKQILVLLVLGACGTALYNGGQKVAPYNLPTLSGDTVQYTALGRVRQGVGAVGSMFVGKVVKGLVDTSVQDMEGMRKALVAKPGMDGVHARKNAKIVAQLDSAALEELMRAHPVAAMNHAMKARDYVSVVKHTLSDP